MKCKVKLIKVLEHNDMVTGLDIELDGRTFRVLIEHRKKPKALHGMIGRVFEVDLFASGVCASHIGLDDPQRCSPDPTWPSGWFAGRVMTIQPGNDHYEYYEEAFDVTIRSDIIVMDTGEMILEAHLGNIETFTEGEGIGFLGRLLVKGIDEEPKQQNYTKKCLFKRWRILPI